MMLKNLLKGKFSFLSRNILILSLVSFFTDIASEMLYPIMPLYMNQIGYGVLTIGIIEGIAEATAGLNKVFFGHISDRSGKRNLFIRIGYGISAFAKPLIGLSKNSLFILFIRFTDRIGKGIRTSPRDAILTAESDPNVRGRVFGFHRGLDTLGAMIGPLLSLAFLYFISHEYTKLFIFALIPGVIAFVLTLTLSKEKNIVKPAQKPKHSINSFRSFWVTSSPTYKRLLGGFLILALLNSTNTFLLLRAKQLGFPDTYIIGSYVLYNLVGAFASYPLGAIADRYGFKPVFIAGILIFSLTYSLLGNGVTQPGILLGIFGLYGIFGAVDEGVGKAWLTMHIDPQYKATGLGLHLTLNSLGFLVASIGTALLWNMTGAKFIFSLVAIGGLALIAYFVKLKEN